VPLARKRKETKRAPAVVSSINIFDPEEDLECTGKRVLTTGGKSGVAHENQFNSNRI
jgi:hypothetical protein